MDITYGRKDFVLPCGPNMKTCGTNMACGPEFDTSHLVIRLSLIGPQFHFFASCKNFSWNEARSRMRCRIVCALRESDHMWTQQVQQQLFIGNSFPNSWPSIWRVGAGAPLLLSPLTANDCLLLKCWAT